jgi:hypothetical protein
VAILGSFPFPSPSPFYIFFVSLALLRRFTASRLPPPADPSSLQDRNALFDLLALPGARGIGSGGETNSVGSTGTDPDPEYWPYEGERRGAALSPQTLPFHPSRTPTRRPCLGASATGGAGVEEGMADGVKRDRERERDLQRACNVRYMTST